MDRVKQIGKKAVLIAFIVFVCYLITQVIMWTETSITDPTYRQGEAVTIISNITEIKDDQVCQKVDHANVSYTGEKDKNWFRSIPGIIGFPSTQYYIIKADSTQIWVDESNLEKFDPVKYYCSPLPKK